MATVKIYLDKGETPDQAQETLRKALKRKIEGTEEKEKYLSTPANNILTEMQTRHAEMWTNILEEIDAVINEDL